MEKKKLSRAGYKEQQKAKKRNNAKNEGLTNLRVIADLIRVGEFVGSKVESSITYVKEFFDGFFL